MGTDAVESLLRRHQRFLSLAYRFRRDHARGYRVRITSERRQSLLSIGFPDGETRIVVRWIRWHSSVLQGFFHAVIPDADLAQFARACRRRRRTGLC
jgi:hypothetical protein